MAYVTFENPPIVEKLLGVFFRTRAPVSSAMLGELWSRHFAELFPNTQDRQPVREPIDEFNPDADRKRVSDSLGNVRPWRIWSSSADEQEAIQLQDNAFFLNWVWHRERWPYRHFNEHLDRFSAHLMNVAKYFRSKQGDGPTFLWAIVAYVNHLPCSEAEAPLRQLDDTLVVWNTIDLAGGQSKARRAKISLTFPMPDDIGWLDVAVAPFRDGENRPVWRFELAANARIPGQSMEDVQAVLSTAHKFLVAAFVELTTDNAHRLWGMRQIEQEEHDEGPDRDRRG